MAFREELGLSKKKQWEDLRGRPEAIAGYW